MPSLFRFLFVVGLIAGVVTGSLYVLAEYFQPEPKDISKSLRNVKVHESEQPAVAPPDVPPTAPPAAPSAPAVPGAQP